MPPFALPLLALAWWLIAGARATGGRGPYVVTIGLGLTLAAVVAPNGVRRAPRAIVWGAVWMSVAAVLVALTAPTGWAGAANAADYVGMAWLAVAIAGARAGDAQGDVGRLVCVVAAVAVAVEFAEGWLAWWGGRNPAAPMLGTFYWHDPFAAFMAAGALLSLALWLTERGPIAMLGMLGFALGSTGVVFSTSRAAQAMFGLCLLAGVAAIVTVARSLWRRALAAGAVAAAVSLLISGPPFFPHWQWFGAGTAARGSAQSLAQNGGYRLQFWHEALSLFARHPLTGGGFHSLATLTIGHVPAGWALSPLAHNGYLQALSDGGLVLGIPVAVGAALAALLALRSLWSALRGRSLSPQRFGVPLAVLFLLGHSFVDFDWSYPVVMVLTGALAATLVRPLPATESEPGSGRARNWTWSIAAAALFAVAVVVPTGLSAWHGDLQLSLPAGTHAAPGSDGAAR